MKYLNSHAKGGDTYNHYIIANEINDSILIFGSSRAIHHYNPKIIEDSINLPVYNVGLDGNGILYNYSRLLSIINRYSPKIIIYDIMPSADMSSDDYSKYLQWQKRLYEIPGINEVFNDINPMEKIKMRSNLYKYNSSFLQIISDNIRPMQEISYKGFKPLEGLIDYEPKDTIFTYTQHWDPLKFKYFQKFVDICKENNIQLIIGYSPWYKKENSDLFKEFNLFANKNNLIIIDLCADNELSFNPNFFVDETHMNNTGAEVFTKKFISILKDSL